MQLNDGGESAFTYRSTAPFISKRQAAMCKNAHWRGRERRDAHR